MTSNYFNHRHIPTGKLCHVMSVNGKFAFCDFGPYAIYPFCSLLLAELEIIN